MPRICAILSFVFICCCFFAQEAGAQAPLSGSYQAISSVSVEELKSAIADKKPIFILDVRKKGEYDAGHIDGATLIPLDTLAVNLGKLHTNKPIVVYCRAQKGGTRGAAFLQSMGLKDVFVLAGGYEEWAKDK